ncbi:hypothetical protein EON63_01895 [archaeon]|nr:MAG: hypothetical protein EON63_01895 [archaeon]
MRIYTVPILTYFQLSNHRHTHQLIIIIIIIITHTYTHIHTPYPYVIIAISIMPITILITYTIAMQDITQTSKTTLLKQSASQSPMLLERCVCTSTATRSA